MSLSRKKLYILLSAALIAGYTWIFYENTANPAGESDDITVCLLKHVTNIPCPSCGSTRAVVSLLHGNFITALTTNPMGIIIALIMIFTPVWIMFDLITEKKTLLEFYYKTEDFLRKPKVAVPLIVLVFINWIWNITKGL
jgi:hypothetical protein